MGNPIRDGVRILRSEFLSKFSRTVRVDEEIVNRRFLVRVHNISKGLAVSAYPCDMSSIRSKELLYDFLNSFHVLDRDGVRDEAF